MKINHPPSYFCFWQLLKHRPHEGEEAPPSTNQVGSPSLGLFTCSSLLGSRSLSTLMTRSCPLVGGGLCGEAAGWVGGAGVKSLLQMLPLLEAGESFQLLVRCLPGWGDEDKPVLRTWSLYSFTSVWEKLPPAARLDGSHRSAPSCWSQGSPEPSPSLCHLPDSWRTPIKEKHFGRRGTSCFLPYIRTTDSDWKQDTGQRSWGRRGQCALGTGLREPPSAGQGRTPADGGRCCSPWRSPPRILQAPRDSFSGTDPSF